TRVDSSTPPLSTCAPAALRAASTCLPVPSSSSPALMPVASRSPGITSDCTHL
ncbi:hypothetical protein K466DRAFT_249730, partial [Polyporus arcularius HHB13444]